MLDQQKHQNDSLQQRGSNDNDLVEVVAEDEAEAEAETEQTPTNTMTNLMATTSEDELSTQTAIKIEIQDVDATMRNTTINSISGNMKANTILTSSTSPTKKSGHGQDVKRITFDESCKKESFDDVNPNYPQISVVVRPPTPLRGDSVKPSGSLLLDGSGHGAISMAMGCSSLLGVRAMNAEIRRHSSHAPGLAVREIDKDKDRRHSGFNPNLLTLDPEHARFLSSSPAASRRISCGSLFKVSVPSSLQDFLPHDWLFTKVKNRTCSVRKEYIRMNKVIPFYVCDQKELIRISRCIHMHYHLGGDLLKVRKYRINIFLIRSSYNIIY